MTTVKSSVLFVVADIDFFFSHRIALAHAAENAGYAVTVAAPGAATSAKLRQAGFRGLDWQVDAGGLNPLREIVTVFSLWNIIRGVAPGIIHAVGVRAIVPAALAGRFQTGKPLVCLFTGLGFLFTGDSIKSRLVRAVLKPVLRVCFARRNLALVFQNADDRDTLSGAGYVPADKTELIRGSGVDTAFFTPQPEPAGPEKVVTLPARLLGDKGVREFIEAARILRGRNEKIRFQIAGAHDPKNPTCLSEAEIGRAIAAGHVAHLGFCENMKEVYAKSHVVCLPSYREGLPRALLEAAACGRAIVTTDVPGCREVVVDRKSGFLVPVRDPAALAAAIENLAVNDAFRLECGRVGRCLVEENFSIERINRETLDVYARVRRSNAR